MQISANILYMGIFYEITYALFGSNSGQKISTIHLQSSAYKLYGHVLCRGENHTYPPGFDPGTRKQTKHACFYSLPGDLTLALYIYMCNTGHTHSVRISTEKNAVFTVYLLTLY